MEFSFYLANLPIRLQAAQWAGKLANHLSAGGEASLTAYDATCLELAMRRNLPLATLDDALRRAAPAEGVALIG